MDLAGKKVLVAGTGKSGIGCIKLLTEENACITVFDNGNNVDEAVIIKRLQDAGIDPEGKEINAGDISSIGKMDLAVLSPGIDPESKLAADLKDKGIPVIGEIELAFRQGKGTVTAITGTNGKTTTTALTGEILSRFFNDVKVVGNIGNPYTEAASGLTDDSRVVAEISSFQLQTTVDFHPHVTAILNITPDHLDRHKTMENYIEAKFSIAKNQTAEDYIILNHDDDNIRNYKGDIKPCRIWFSSKEKIKGFYYREGAIFDNTEGINERLITSSEMNILGIHNMENAMAAMAMAKVQGVPPEVIWEAVSSFKAVEHRIEYVRTFNDIDFYNDSKGTNTDAAIKAVMAMTRPSVVIGGGYDKNSEFDDWIETFPGRVRHLVLMGETRDKIADCAKAHGFTDISFADDLEDAVNKAYKAAKAGDAVLLSPACASWDMFRDYEERGRLFKELVNGLK